MKKRLTTAGVTMAAALFVASAAQAATATLTGTVGDAMCGAKHMMAGDAAACTAACVAKGSDYALIVGDKVYTLKATDAQKADLAKVAGKQATIVGDQDGETIKVSSVRASR
jgi:hypothetical protein